MQILQNFKEQNFEEHLQMTAYFINKNQNNSSKNFLNEMEIHRFSISYTGMVIKENSMKLHTNVSWKTVPLCQDKI